MRSFGRALLAISLSVILILTAAGQARADDQDEEASHRANSLQAGAWSIQFGLTDEFGLDPFNSMSLSLKRHVSPKSAFRLGANLGLDVDDSDSESVSTRYDTLSTGVESELSLNGVLVQLNMLYMRYVNPGSDVNFFLGTGPLVRYTRTEEDRRSVRTAQGEVLRLRTEKYSRTWKLGALGVAGVEWFATKNVSLHAEYRGSLSYGRTKTEGLSLSSDDPSYHEESESSKSFWDFKGVNVTFGLSLYF